MADETVVTTPVATADSTPANVVDQKPSATADNEANVEDTSNADNAASATADENGDQGATKQPEDGSEPRGAEKRIKQLVAKNHELEQRLNLQQTLLQQQLSQAPVIADLPPEPNLDKYDDFSQWEKDHQAWDRQLIAQQVTQSIAKNNQQIAAQQKDAIFNTRIAIEATVDPEIPVIMNDRTLPVSPVMALLIKESDMPGKILRYLHEHRDEAMAMGRLQPVNVAKAMGALEAKIASEPAERAPAPKLVSQAPTPVKTVEGKGRSTVRDEDLPIDEWVKRRNEKQFHRR